VPEPVTLDVARVAQHVADVCRRTEGVAAAYLFGSVLGRCRPDSDIDVAVSRATVRGGPSCAPASTSRPSFLTRWAVGTDTPST
jgi:hypothetical protein